MFVFTFLVRARLKPIAQELIFEDSTHRIDAPDPVEPRDDGVDGAGAAPRLATADLGPGQPEVGPEEAGQAEVGGDRGRVD